jgi:flagellar hook protein FlgE
MGFQQGLSGLGASSRALDVISSNVANSGTVGFKSSSAVFADSFASAMTGGVSNLQVGMGGNTLAIRQSFTQGATTATNNPLDMAIAGNGFFEVKRNNDSIAYSRNGQFDLDKDGYIVNSLGERLQGYQTLNLDGSVLFLGSTTPRSILVPPEGISAKATGGGDANADSIPDGDPLSIRGNLDASATAPDPVATPFSSGDPNSYNYTTSATVYDSLGKDHNVSMYFVKSDPAVTPNEWDVYVTFDGVDLLAPNTPDSTVPNRIGFRSSDGAFDATLSTGIPIAMLVDTTTLGSGAAPLLFDIDLTGFTQHSSDSTVFEISQDGSPPGELAGVSVSSSGVVEGRYTNGETRELAQVVLVTFRNPNGLVSLGDNLWAESGDSGQPVVGAPGAGLNGTIGSGRVEESNVDMSAELVNMIIQQRNYQANAQSIKTQDQILQTLINLR